MTLRQEFLTLLAAQGEHGIRLDKMPTRFLNTNLLTVCDAERVIEFLQRNHEYKDDNLSLFNGWDIRHFTGPNMKPLAAFIGEILAKPDAIAEHVRLTGEGRVEAARLALEQPAAAPAKPNETTNGADDHDDGFVMASVIWKGRFGTYREFRKWLADHPEIPTKPNGKQRFRVHAVKCLEVLAKRDQAAFDRLDDGEHRGVVPDTVDTEQFLENTGKLFREVNARKKPQK